MLTSAAGAYTISGSADKIIYETGDTVRITGNASAASVLLTLNVTNSTSDVVLSTTNTSVSGGSYVFSFSAGAADDYTARVYNGSDYVLIHYKVVSELLTHEANLINNTSIIPINTSTLITTDNAMGGNFTELRDLSKSGTLHYGFYNFSGRNWSFVLVDENLNETYDTLYVDDDMDFRLYNDTEDSGDGDNVERQLKQGKLFESYLIKKIEFSTGNKVFLAIPVPDSVYGTGETAYFMMFVENSTHHLKQDQAVAVNITIRNKAGTVVNSLVGTTNSWGYFNSSFSTPSTAGIYTINANDTAVEIFSVEAFRLFGKVTDVTGSPTYSFAPNSKIKFEALSKTLAGALFNLSSISTSIILPNGSSTSVSMSVDSTGSYSGEWDSTGYPTGEYGVQITGTDSSSNQQTINLGFAIETLTLTIQPINTKYVDEAEGPGAFVTAFAPGKNMTLMVMLQNVTGGGFGPEGPTGMVDIDNSSTADDECDDYVTLEKLTDENGVSYLGSISYLVKNLTDAIDYLPSDMQPPGGEGPPKEVQRQCMIIFVAPNKTGIYNAVVKVAHPLETKEAGSTFGVQRLFARGKTVDFHGEEFGFFAPNSTVRIKLNVRDLLTDTEIPGENITSVKLIEMWKEFPEPRQDVFTPAYRAAANESVANGTISFTSPNSEGFFLAKFRFKADVGGTEMEGTGDVFFMLKKYFIWAEVDCGQNFCFVNSGKNVTLKVNVVDIEKGKFVGGVGGSMSCTGCTGLIAEVDKLINFQIEKEIPTSDYNVSKGAVTNSTSGATITLTGPSAAQPTLDIPTGWYGVDIILRDPDNSNITYMGWGWFEIRNFFIDTAGVQYDGQNYTMSWETRSFEKSGDVLFSAVARNPGTWDILTPDSAPVVENVLYYSMRGPPSPVSYSSSVSLQNVSMEGCYGPGCTEEMYVFNLTGLEREGEHQANVKFTVGGKSDIGSFWFETSSYKVDTKYRGSDQWPVVFEPYENITVTFTATDFNNSPHNLSTQGTGLYRIFNEKLGKPEKANYSTSCTGNVCNVTFNVSLTSGFYFAEFNINDTSGVEKTEGIDFFVKNYVLGVPVLSEGWVWTTDSPDFESGDVYNQDRCDNQINAVPDTCSSNTTHVCDGVDIEFLQKDISDSYRSAQYCIDTVGQWMWGDCSYFPNGTEAYVVRNDTHAWIGNSSNLSAETAMTNYSTFSLAGKTWNITNIDSNDLQLRHTDGKICGESWVCGTGGCAQNSYVLIPPQTDTTYYHGYVNLARSEGLEEQFPGFNTTKPAYAYHNTTHLWMSGGTDMSGATAYAIDQVIPDPYGGEWKVKSLSNNVMKLSGENVLAETGSYINTNYTQSKKVKIGMLREEQMGAWTMSGNKGLDINGNGMTNDTVYFALTDNASSGYYDMFFYSGDSNFTNPISINDNISTRTFGDNDTITLLNIDPRAEDIKVYSKGVGEWSDIGEYKLGDNISIPVVVTTPAGADTTANVTVKNARVRTTAGEEIKPLGSGVTEEITGKGEIKVNLSDYALGAGEYRFEIIGKRNGVTENLDEWKWPFTRVRLFLSRSEQGMGGYIRNFKPVYVHRYDPENYGDPVDLYTVNDTSIDMYIEGVLDFDGCDRVVENSSTSLECPGVSPLAISNCPGSVAYPPDDAGIDPVNRTFVSSLPGYYYFVTAANASKLWVNTANCTFNDTSSTALYDMYDPINITYQGKKYMLFVLNASATSASVVVGFDGVNSSVIEPLRISDWSGNPAPKWRAMALTGAYNVSGAEYMALLSNNTSVEYPMCTRWNTDECAKSAWFSTDGNFTGVSGTPIGGSFATDLYLGRVGPGSWDGMVIINSTGVSPPVPAADVRAADDSPAYWSGAISEASVGLDLDMDKSLGSTFYMIGFDDREDGQQDLTNILTDDDTMITEPWWQNSSGSGAAYTDYYGNEQASISEQWGNAPTGIYYGNVRFAEINESYPYELRPEWNIKRYNKTDMLLFKDRWTINNTDNITFAIRIYDFDQSAIQGATAEVLTVYRFGAFGASKLTESTDYTVNYVQNVTDDGGYALIELAPVGAWPDGDYMLNTNVTYGSTSETVDNWFQIGDLWAQAEGGGGGP
ncbi:MAG: hypothetical protein ACE5J7_02545 [Candidatus Aenigmatarchaeota archaeon]